MYCFQALLVSSQALELIYLLFLPLCPPGPRGLDLCCSYLSKVSSFPLFSFPILNRSKSFLINLLLNCKVHVIIVVLFLLIKFLSFISTKYGFSHDEGFILFWFPCYMNHLAIIFRDVFQHCTFTIS